MKLVAVGEAWGRREAQFQHALVGPSGRELTLEMGIAKLAPFMLLLCRKCKAHTEFIDGKCRHCGEHVWPNEFDLIEHWKRLRTQFGIAVTNVFNTQPPNNDLGHFFGTEPQTDMTGWKASKQSGGSHVKSEFYFHLKRLWKEIEDLDPAMILCLGNAACWALIDQTRITSLRGTLTWGTRTSRKILPTFHPAAVMRQLPMRVSVIADMTKAAKEMEFREIRRKERWFTIPDPTEAGIQEIWDWYKRPARAYANDIETWRGQISIVGFARTNDDALVIPFRHPEGENYWPTPELEFRAWKAMIAGVESDVPKIYQNGLFDIYHYMRIGIFPKNIAEDTMLWHHAMYPELPKSLGFLGSIYANEISWKQMRRRETLKRDE